MIKLKNLESITMKSEYPVPLTINQPLLEFFLFSGGLLVCLFHPFKNFLAHFYWLLLQSNAHYGPFFQDLTF